MSEGLFPRNNAPPSQDAPGASRLATSQDRRKRSLPVEVESKSKKKKTNGNASVAMVAATTTPAEKIGLGMAKLGASNKIVRIEPASFSRYTAGTLVLGYVLQITDHGLVVSLPGGLTGTVAVSEISDYLHKHSKEASSQKPTVSALISIYQPVICYLLEKDDTARKLSLSMRSALINRGVAFKHLTVGFPISGCISSVEDHGFVISAGIAGVNFFLPFKNVPTGWESSPVGRPVNCVVQEVNDAARAVTLRAQKKAVVEAITRGTMLSFNAIVPGMLVNAVVDKIVENGLTLSFLGSFYGVVDQLSLPSLSPGKDWQAAFHEGDMVKARVVYIDHGDKSCRLSLRPHVLEFRVPGNFPRLGDMVENASVVTANKNIGVYFVAERELSHEIDESTSDNDVTSEAKKNRKKQLAKSSREQAEKQLTVFVHKSSLAPTGESVVEKGQQRKKRIDAEDIEKSYRPGHVEPAIRVTGYHLVEGVVLGSNLEVSLANELTHWTQVKVGQILHVTVSAVRDSGLVVKANDRVRALCPLQHLADSLMSTKTLAKKFNVGQKLKVRVWEINGSSIIVTHKKTLVEDTTNSVVSSFEEAQEGSEVQGVVTSVSDEGLRVHFLNSVKGFVPMRILLQQGVSDVGEAYRVGQLVRCVLLRKFAAKECDSKGHAYRSPSLLLALALGDSNEIMAAFSAERVEATPASALKSVEGSVGNSSLPNGENSKLALRSQRERLVLGEVDFASGVISKRNEDSLSVLLDDGRQATLPFVQCFDFSCTAQEVFESGNNKEESSHLASSYAIGKRIENALILSITKEGAVQLSLKPLLLAVAHQVKDGAAATSLEDIRMPSKASQLTPGQVVAGYVHKVESFGVLVRFLNSFTALAPRPNLADKFVSTPVGMFTPGDSIRCLVQRVDLETEKVIVSFKSSLLPPSSGERCYLSALLRERFLTTPSSAGDEWKSLKIGSFIDCSVEATKDQQITLRSVKSSVKCICSKDHKDGAVKTGSACTARVLDFDILKNALDVSLLSRLSSHKGSKKSPKKEVGLVLGAQLKIRIELIKEEYLVGSTDSSAIVFVPVVDYNTPYVRSSTLGFQVGQELNVKIERVGSTEGEFPHAGVLMATPLLANRELKKPSDRMEVSLSDKRSSFLNSLAVGARMQWKVEEISPLEVKLLPLNAIDLDAKFYALLHVTGAIDISSPTDNLLDALEAKSPKKKPLHPLHPFAQLSVGQELTGQILQVRRKESGTKHGEAKGSVIEDDDHDRLELDNTLVYVSIQPFLPSAQESTIQPKLLQWQGANCVKKNAMYPGVVTRIDETGCTLAFSPYVFSRLNFVDVSTDKATVKKFRKKCFLGLRLIAAVTDMKTSQEGPRTHKSLILNRACIEQIADGSMEMDASALPSIPFPIEIPDMLAGQTVTGMLDLKCAHVPKPPAVMVTLPFHRHGRVCATELSDVENWSDAIDLTELPDGRKHGDIVKCRVLSASDNHIELSLRESRLACKKKSDAKAPDGFPEEGSIVKGFVTNTTLKGCFVRLSNQLTGMVQIRDLSDEFVVDPSKDYPCGKLVEARVLSVNHASATAKLSLKASNVHGDVKLAEELQSLQVGGVVTGRVDKITDFGVFVKIDGTSLVGLSRREAAISSSSTSDLRDLYEVGDAVRAKVLSVSVGTKKIGLGLKPSFFRKNDTEDDENDVDMDNDGDMGSSDENLEEFADENGGDSDEEIADVIRKASLPIIDDDKDNESNAEDSNSENDVSVDMEVEESNANQVVKSVKELSNESDESDEDESPSSTLFGGSTTAKASSSKLRWDDFGVEFRKADTLTVENSDTDSDDETEANGNSAKRARNKESKRRKQEEEIRKREAALLDRSLIPEKPQDFERLLIAEPNSSFLWIQYMAFHLTGADIDAARAVAERALRTIGFREEEERFNVWKAWLNVELKYGSVDSLESVFKRAVAESKGKIIHLGLAHMYEETGDATAAAAMFEKTLKKYKYSKKVWSEYQLFRLRQGDEMSAKDLLSRSMQSLSRHKHVYVIEKFALGEFEFGSPDRARVVFEELLSSYPKRTDLWHVYVDKEVKMGNIPQARQLFERMTTLKSSVKNMQTVFKKYLAFEVEHGSIEQQEAVKQKAREYVNSMI